MRSEIVTIEGAVLDESGQLTLTEICSACSTSAEWIVTLVEEGILEPKGDEIRQWRFTSVCLKRARTVRRIQDDLGVNLAGAALALELIEEVSLLRRRLARFEEQSEGSGTD